MRATIAAQRSIRMVARQSKPSTLLKQPVECGNGGGKNCGIRKYENAHVHNWRKSWQHKGSRIGSWRNQQKPNAMRGARLHIEPLISGIIFRMQYGGHMLQITFAIMPTKSKFREATIHPRARLAACTQYSRGSALQPKNTQTKNMNKNATTHSNSNDRCDRPRHDNESETAGANIHEETRNYE
jgi:hypothetical protein